MAKKPRTRNITLGIESGTFTGIFRRLRGQKKGYDFSGISALRQLFSNERARILHAIKTKQPESIYKLAKILERDFKSVRQDIKLLERFGFVELDAKAVGKRDTLKPILAVDKVEITINI
jgi:predicted transcriptional regulator